MGFVFGGPGFSLWVFVAASVTVLQLPPPQVEARATQALYALA